MTRLPLVGVISAVTHSWRVILRYATVAAASALYLYPFARVLWHVGDEGLLVYGAVRVVNGEVPYRDFFEIMGPGSFYWLALFFKVLGINWVAARIALLVSGIGTTLLLYGMTRHLRSRHESLPAAFVLVLGIPLFPAISHHWDSNFFALLSFVVLLVGLETKRRAVLVLVGLLGGITTCFMPQKGLLLVTAFLLVLWVVRRQAGAFTPAAASLLVGYVAVGVLVMLAFAVAGAGRDLVHANLVWPLSRYRDVNATPYAYGLWELTLPGWFIVLELLSPPWAAYSMCLLFLLPFLFVVLLPMILAGLAVPARRTLMDGATLPYWIVGSALWFSEIHRWDILHLVYGSPVLVVLGFHYWGQQTSLVSRLAVRLVVLGLFLLAVFDGVVASMAQNRVDTRRGTVYTFTKDDALTFLDAHTSIGEEIYVYPYYPMYYFLSATKNATRFSILMYHYNTDQEFKEAISDLERKQVRYVLWDTIAAGKHLKTWFPGYQHPPEDRLIIEPYLRIHYEVVGFGNGFRILKRRSVSTG